MKASGSLFVALNLPGQPMTPVGSLHFLITPERRAGIFRYLSDYDGPPLNPARMDYRREGKRDFAAFGDELMDRVFLTALPGKTGRNILAQSNPEIHRMSNAELLLLLGNRTVGALGLMVSGPRPELPLPGMKALIAFEEKLRGHLTHAASGFNPDIPLPPQKTVSRRPFADLAFSDQERNAMIGHGGVRPKVTVKIKDHEGKTGHWLAKFNLIDDSYFNNVRVEKTMSDLARSCGINAAKTAVVGLADGHEALLVERFDLGENEGQEWSSHKVSMYAMCDPGRVREQNQADYREYFDIIDRVSSNPRQDTEEMFRRLLFNFAANNHDDHANNHEMKLVADKSGTLGYRLTECFDMVPNPVATSHESMIAGKRVSSAEFGWRNRDISDLVERLGIRSRIGDVMAIEIKDQVVAGLADCVHAIEKNGVHDNDIGQVLKALSISGAIKPDPVLSYAKMQTENAGQDVSSSAVASR